MKTLTQQFDDNVKNVLWMGLFIPGINGRRGLPYILLGEPGTAKTSIISQIAKHANLYFESVLGSLRSPIDFLGLPIPKTLDLTEAEKFRLCDDDSDVMTMSYAPAGFALRCARAQRSLILFDELNTSPPAVMAAMLRVVLEGVVGELTLPAQCRILLAMNETEDSAGGWEIPPPMANRLGWIKWQPPSVASFGRYLQDYAGAAAASIDPTMEEHAVDALWPEAYGIASSMVVQFLHVNSVLLHKKPKSGTPEASRAWPSPRSWEMATRALAGCYIYDLKGEAMQIAISAFIGADAYKEFYQWLKTMDLPSPKDVLDGKITFTHNPRRLDITYTFLNSCAAYIAALYKPNVASSLHDQKALALWQLLTVLLADVPDIIVPVVRVLINKRILLTCPQAVDVLSGLDPLLRSTK